MTELILGNVKQQISETRVEYEKDLDMTPLTTRLRLSRFKSLRAKVKNVFNIADNLLPEHKSYFLSLKNLVNQYDTYSLSDAQEALEHILEIIEIEESSELKIKELKIFESAEDKLKQAGHFFRNENFPSVFNNLNSALELVLKDKIEIPTTLTGINTTNVIELLVKEKINCYKYFDEAKKRVTLIDNKIKHVGYTPSQPECVSALRAMEDLMSKLRNKEIKISDKLRNKIFESLYDRKGKSSK